MSESGPARDFVSSVGLLVTGTDLRPSDVTAALGLEPDNSWCRGDPKPVGTDLHDWGGWKKRIARRDDGLTLTRSVTNCIPHSEETICRRGGFDSHAAVRKKVWAGSLLVGDPATVGTGWFFRR